MPSRDQYGNEIYSQGEYERHIMMGIPFTGFVDGVGYVLSEVVATPRSIGIWRTNTNNYISISH